MPELWLRKTFPGVIFANSNLPEDRYRICRNEEEIKEMPEDSSYRYLQTQHVRPICGPTQFNVSWWKV